MTDQEQQVYLAEQTRNLPSNKNASASVSDSILLSFSNAMDNTIHPSEWPLNEKPVVSEVLTKGIQSILIGEKNANQVAKLVQKRKDQLK